jgi:DNA repair protein RadD
MKTWLTIDEAAKYLVLGKTLLYDLARTDKIPASKVGKQWRFDKDALDAWVSANKPLETFFTATPADIDDNLALREPQREGYQQAYNFFDRGGKVALIQIPVGCGKSGLAAILPFGIARGRVLYIAPNLTIKENLFETLDVTNRAKCFWRKTRVLRDVDMLGGPYACTLEEGNVSIAEKSHIVVTNVQQLSANTEKWLNRFPNDFFDMIIVDEGHHSAATSWKQVFERFPQAKVVNLTATPFRSDRQTVGGELIYRYPFKSASVKGYIKKLKSVSVAPVELTFTAQGETKTYTLDEVLALKEEAWFSRGIALSEPCNVSIVDNSLEKLERLRESGTRHQIIAVACSIRHAKQIRSLYEERGYAAAVIHSKQDAAEQRTVLRDLRNGTLDCIVQVQMLGEGFDHPKLSVAAIFNPFRSLAPYIQFVGRILRVVVQRDPRHPDNYGFIVTHVGLNLDQQLRDFRGFENDDRAFWESVTGGDDPEPPTGVLDGSARQRVSEPMIVEGEIVESVFEEDFVGDEKDALAELQRQAEALGLDASLIEEAYARQRVVSRSTVEPAAPAFQVLPQRQWREAKRRLHEEVQRTAKLVLNICELEMSGREMPYRLNLGVSGQTNFVCALQLLNTRVNRLVSPEKPREQWTTYELLAAKDNLPDIKQRLVREIKRAQAVASGA